MINFYDTCSLLLKGTKVFEEDTNFLISSITLNELENIKTSTNKDPEVKYQARQLLRLLDKNTEQYSCVVFKQSMLKPFIEKDLEITNDLKILACAYSLEADICFVTNDLALKQIAKMFIQIVTSINEEDIDEYYGYKEVHLNDEQMANLYSNITENLFELNINEYLLVYNTDGVLVDELCWDGQRHRNLNYSNFNSKHFGKVRPKSGDAYQRLACDSLVNNQITMLKGPAGSGKTLLSLGYLINQMEQGYIDKIIVFCNTVATKNSARLGFYPGTRDEKLLDSQIGNLLASKFGSKLEVERMINDEKIVLLPLSDVRGFDTTGMAAGVYISEAQNLDVSLMKLALQRIGEDSICIIDGDEKTQVDDIAYAGANNGMKRASKIFRGHDIYGEVELKNIHRSKIGKIAELM